MVEALHTRESITNSSKRVIIDDTDLVLLASKTIDEFVTKKSLVLLEQFGVTHDFLDFVPELWYRSRFSERFNDLQKCPRRKRHS